MCLYHPREPLIGWNAGFSFRAGWNNYLICVFLCSSFRRFPCRRKVQIGGQYSKNRPWLQLNLAFQEKSLNMIKKQGGKKHNSTSVTDLSPLSLLLGANSSFSCIFFVSLPAVIGGTGVHISGSRGWGALEDMVVCVSHQTSFTHILLMSYSVKVPQMYPTSSYHIA